MALPPEAEKWLKEHQQSFGHFISNQWYKPEGRKTLDSQSPSNNTFLATTLEGIDDDVDKAVTAAKEAAKTWAALPGYIRGRHLYNIARTVQKHLLLFAQIEALDNGKCIFESTNIDIPLLLRWLDVHAGYAQIMEDDLHGKWKPVGVVAAIVTWTFPLAFLSWKVCPALAVGNTVVLKPASSTRLSALLFAEICAEAGLPPGVLNVVTGSGSLGSSLSVHPDVDKVAFSGSKEVGKLLRRITAGSGKRLSLELGGKSPMIVHEDCDLNLAVRGIHLAAFLNQGELGSAGSRLLVHRNIHDSLIYRLKIFLSSFKVGSSMDEEVYNGSIVDQKQWEAIEQYVRSACREGAVVWQSWDSLPEEARATPDELAKDEVSPKKCGLFYPPTIITNISRDARVVRDDVSGPILCVFPFDDPKESIELANDTDYGLAASIWTKNVFVGLESCLHIKAGVTWINAHNMMDTTVGFGGCKASGFGRGGCKEGLIEYMKPAWSKSYGEGDDPCAGLSIDLTKFGIARKTDGQPVDETCGQFFINGKVQSPIGPARKIRNPSGFVIATVGEANDGDIKEAIAAAKVAAPVWGERAVFQRGQILLQMADHLEKHKSDFCAKFTQTTGDSDLMASREVDLSIERLFYWAAYAENYGGHVSEPPVYACALKIHEPLGVIGISCPDEFPLLAFVSLLAPAIARGNAVIITPSERHPLAALEFYKVFEMGEIPAGIVNVLTGDRDYIAKHFSEHVDVTAVWYFGSAEGSKFVEVASADQLKRTFVNYGRRRNWDDPCQGQGLEFLSQASQSKSIWIPISESFMR